MTRDLLPTGDLHAARPVPGIANNCRLSVLSAALGLALGSVSFQAEALTMGRLNVLSALGEPLRAEIDVTEISGSEAEGLRVNIAPASAFNAAGVNYNNALADIRIALQRRADGRYVIRLNGNRPLNDPFVDLLLEANWNTGRIVRDYTVLLDPPGHRQSSAVPIAPTAPQVTAPSRSLAPAPLPPVAPAAAPPVAQAPVAATPPRRQRGAAPTPDATLRSGSGGGDQQVTVKPGDTASRLAAAYKPADISLDQMLVALLRANPNAFIGGNINRIKAGAVLEMPGTSQTSGIEAGEARRTVTAQSRDFNEYRRRLADNAPSSAMAAADRQATGRLQANVQDRNAVTSPDRLTLSQGASGKAASDEQLVKAREAKENNARAAELSKNISELNKLQAAASGSSAPTPGASPGAATSPPAGVAPAPAAAAPSTPAASTAAPAEAATGASAPVATLPAVVSPSVTATPPIAAPAPAADAAASAPAVPAAVAPAPKPAATPPAPERGFLADLMDNPVMLAAAALIALLIAFLLYRVLGRKKKDAGDSVFLESRMPKDSFFGASGGESVDTKDRHSSMVSSLSYSPSQLDAGDVDPVAEADVYLAYGRDLQAEEILREALRTNPERVAIHFKLLEIHAKRRDLRAFEVLATEVHKLTGGNGSDWNRVAELGRDLDPGNPLYQSGVRPAGAAPAAPVAPTAADAAVLAGTAATVPGPARMPTPEVAAPPPAFVPSVAPLDFDLDLNKPPAPSPAPIVSKPVAVPVSASLPPAPPAAQRAAPQAPQHTGFESTERAPLNGASGVDLENDFDTAPAGLEPITRVASLPDEERTQPATLRAGLPGESGFIEFDMSTMSARTPLHTQPGQLDGEGHGENPHTIKLSLARELHALGDTEGARSLVEEVAAETSGEVKNQAQRLLAELH
jgi:pilus assembly protein FimV